MLKLLAAQGLELNIQNEEGDSPLHLAVRDGQQVSVVEHKEMF